jgi:two-component system response regulator MprA
MTSQLRVLIVDDDARILASLRRVLTYEGYTVDSAADGTTALASAQLRPPDLVVLDVMLPGIDGIEVCRGLRDGGDVPILMLTARDATADRVTGLDSGADDYLVKPFAYEEFLARVRALLRRRPSPQDRPAQYGGLSLDPGTRDITRGARTIQLTALEFELLRHFMRHPRQVLTRQQILESVWGYDSESMSNVVDVYVGYLRQKLEQDGQSRLLHTVRGVGYVLRAD